MELIGTVLHVQVQRSSLKLGARPRRWFDPTPLLAVSTLEVSQDGCTGISEAGERVVDVHCRTHPGSRFNGSNGISLGFTSHYARIRDRLGGNAAGWVGWVAGENVIVRTEREFLASDLPPTLTIQGAAGTIQLTGARVIEPCVEFSRYLLGHRSPPEHDLPAPAEHDQEGPGAPFRPDPTVKDVLVFLRQGTRGYCATHASTHGATIRLGDRVYLLH